MMKMTRTYALKRLLEHGPMTMGEIVDCTRWPKSVCRWVLTYLVDRNGEVDRVDGVYSLSSKHRAERRPVGRPAKVVAWKCYVRGWGDKPQTVTMARTRGRAISRNIASAQNAGYGLKWGDFRVVRSPEHDGMFDTHGLFSWDFDHAQSVLCADQSANVELSGQRPEST